MKTRIRLKEENDLQNATAPLRKQILQEQTCTQARGRTHELRKSRSRADPEQIQLLEKEGQFGAKSSCEQLAKQPTNNWSNHTITIRAA